MSQQKIDNLISAKNNREKMVVSFPPAFAKLYSQHTLLDARRDGLKNWRENDFSLRLDDAMRLTTSGLLEKNASVEGWQGSLSRAGELLEWLAHSSLNTEGLPLELLASALYQIAGYPARATGLLHQSSILNDQSRILYRLLSSDFSNLFAEIAQYWSNRPTIQLQDLDLPWGNADELSVTVNEKIVDEMVSALGVVCSYFRWGDETRIKTAQAKMSAIADLMLHGTDSYSWLLAKLCSEVVSTYFASSMRNNLSTLSQSLSQEGSGVIERYLRQCYLHSKALAWPSQSQGIRQLLDEDSFALCTPTGSGKTTVAEIAILQQLFPKEATAHTIEQTLVPTSNPIVLYLVPSRALATEVEARLSRVLEPLSTTRIVVTGLYGGNDWGPTDAWLTAEDKVILICTYEKAEALMRFLGRQFLHRVTLLIIDEAHNIRHDSNPDSLSYLQKGTSRPLRLEVLSARLFTLLEQDQRRVIALSAVAFGAEDTLAAWVAVTLLDCL